MGILFILHDIITLYITAFLLPHEAQNDPLSNVCHCVLGIVTKYHSVYYGVIFNMILQVLMILMKCLMCVKYSVQIGSS